MAKPLESAMARVPATLRVALGVALLALVALGGLGWWWHQTTGQAPADLHLSGTIEATTVDVGFTEGGRVVRRPVSEGQAVRKGQLLAELDPTPLSEQLSSSEANLKAARAALMDARQGPRPQEIVEARASVAQASAQASEAADRDARGERLYTVGGLAFQDLDSLRKADATAQAALSAARARLNLLMAGTRPEQIAQARARLQQAAAAVAIARTQSANGAVRAPLAGVVLAKHVEPGEVVAPGAPAVTIARLDQVYLRAYVPETDLGRVKLGQTVRITADTYPGKVYMGRVAFISSEAEFTPRAVQTAEERVKLVYRVRVDVPNPNQELKPGMPADATIPLGRTS